MLLKAIGCILTVMSSTIIGYSMAEKYPKRLEELRALQAGLQILETEISFSVNPLPEAFKKISMQGPETVRMIFRHASDLLQQKIGLTAQEAWVESVNKMYKQLHLEEEDLKIVLAFGNSLGCSDRENQIKHIRFIGVQLAAQEKKAEMERERNEKLYKNIGILIGLLIAIIFL